MKYLNQLTSIQIADFLNGNGLFVLDSIEDEIANINGDCDALYLKCYSSVSNENNIISDVKKYLGRKMPINFGSYDFYSNRINIYELTDFTISRLFVDNDFNERDYQLQHNYLDMMMNHFPSTDYKKDFETFLEALDLEK